MIVLRYVEDLFVLAPWLREVLHIHGMDAPSARLSGLERPVRIEMHHRMPDGTEVDLILTNGLRTIAIELKDTSTRVFDQAKARKKWFDYVYAAINWSTHEILSYLAGNTDILEHGVGAISLRDNIVVVRSTKKPSKIPKITFFNNVCDKIGEDTIEYCENLRKRCDNGDEDACVEYRFECRIVRMCRQLRDKK